MAKGNGEAASRPWLFLFGGRGKTGKTRGCLVLRHFLRERGIPHVLLDADRSNWSLSKLLPGEARRPKGRSDNYMRDWLGGELEAAVGAGFSVVADFAGGDPLLRTIAGDVDLEQFADALGANLGLIYALGGDPDDLVGLAEMERDRLLTPRHTALMFNTGAIAASVEPAVAFDLYIENEVVVAALARGAKLVKLPECKAMALLVDKQGRFTPFEDAARLGPWNHQQIVTWLRRSAEPGAMGPVLEWVA